MKNYKKKLAEKISGFETNLKNLNQIKKNLKTQIVDENAKQKTKKKN